MEFSKDARTAMIVFVVVVLFVTVGSSMILGMKEVSCGGGGVKWLWYAIAVGACAVQYFI